MCRFGGVGDPRSTATKILVSDDFTLRTLEVLITMLIILVWAGVASGGVGTLGEPMSPKHNKEFQQKVLK